MFSSPLPAPQAAKRKRRPAGTPDPEAEVVSLSPRTLLESDRYVCEICGQGFQREQNLQMHRRRHKVPWKLLKREGGSEGRKRVFVCPEPSCLHHDPAHALGDLVGIKKHFRRKHSAHRQWACARCSKAYAVHSDFKAHLKTCGTRGHSCDCGRVFSRVESFIEHQDACPPPLLELQLLPDAPAASPPPAPTAPKLELGIGLALGKDPADEARLEARRQMELADQELANAKRIRLQAQLELRKAFALRDRASRKIHSALMQITCYSCQQQFQAKLDECEVAGSHISSALTEGEAEDDRHDHDERPDLRKDRRRQQKD